MRGMWLTVLLAAGLALAPAALAAQQAEINVAASRWGLSRAWASSFYGPGYGPENALDGRWARRETDKWNSARGPNQWIIVDLGDVFTLDRVLIRHEGVCADGDQFNTADFRLQRGQGPKGPWTDLVPPVRGNHANITEHTFAPTPVRYLRIVVDQGEQHGNEYARIFEIEAYAPVATLTRPLASLWMSAPTALRSAAGKLEQRADVEYEAAPGSAPAVLRAEAKGLGAVDLGSFTPGDRRQVWLPIAPGAAMKVRLATATGAEVGSYALKAAGGLLYFAKGGHICIMSSSHQDIAWMDTPQSCRNYRVNEVLKPALDMMASNPRYCFSMESALNLMEFLQDAPDRRADVLKYTREGRMEWGATYSEPYEGLESGEQLIRQAYFGRRYVEKALPGCDARVAFSPDVPGRTLQMPQILAKSGIPYLFFSRFDPGLYRWFSPDGSSILAFSPGMYGNDMGLLNRPPEKAVPMLVDRLEKAGPTYAQQKIPPILGLINTADFARPTDFNPLLQAWAARGDGWLPEGYHNPTAQYSTMRSFLQSVDKPGADFPKLSGDRPNLWVYIHGPTHHWAIDAKREAGRLLPEAECFSTFRALVEGSFASYPFDKLNNAWRDSITADHGWGGKNGEVTDAWFAANFRRARDAGQECLDAALDSLSTHVKTSLARGIPVVVYNPLSWERDDLVTCQVRPPAPRFRVTDAAGKQVVYQVLPAVEGQAPGVVRIGFVATAVPSLGYRSFYVSSGEPAQASTLVKSGAQSNIWQTPHYTVRLAPGGVAGIRDRDLNRELINSSKFLAGELFTMRSFGCGVGDATAPQQPSMEGFDKLSNHRPAWVLSQSESGPVMTVLHLAQDLPDVRVRESLILYSGLKRIDFRVRLLGWAGVPYREFRLAFPIKETGGKVTYEVPMGVVQVGRDELRGSAGPDGRTPMNWPWVAQTRPREVQDFIDASGQGFGVTLAGSVAVWDYADPTTNPVAYPMLQPVLLASRRSCNSAGNWYLQAGDHDFSFSLTSHASDWRGGYRHAIEANWPLLAVMGPKPRDDASLPAQMSFASVSAPNVLISTIKRCEDDNDVAVRCVDMEGKDAEVAVHLFRPIAEAQGTNMIEEPEHRPLPVRDGSAVLRVGHDAIETMKLRLAR